MINTRLIEILKIVSRDPFLRDIANDKERYIVYVYEEKPAEIRWGPEVEQLDLPKTLIEHLKSRGIKRLMEYQWTAYNAIKSGKDVVIVSGTGTGKTEAFILPLVSRLLSERDSIALILYPTKALARDQYLRIREYADKAGLRVEVYDGDTPEEARRRIYASPPEILITNPDMLHYALLYVDKFKAILPRVRLVVLDDFHMYEGVFGTHVHYVLRRLERFCKNLQYVATTATIGNPDEFGRLMFRREVHVIHGVSGRRSIVRHVLLKTNRAKVREAVELVKLAVRHGKKGIVFADSHRLVEVIKKLLDKENLGHLAAVHRAGLTREERAEIEDKFREGKLMFLIATPTLEIGIDIGTVDIAIMATMPPSYIRYLQRSGRVGRRGQVSHVVQILGSDPISTYFERFPEEFFNRRPEPLHIDPQNKELAKLHLLAMCEDAPVRLSELTDFEYDTVMELAEEGLVKIVRDRYVILTETGRKVLSQMRSLRGAGDRVRIVIKTGREEKEIGERELPIAIRELFPNAVYLHGGKAYRVTRLDLKTRKAYVEKLWEEPSVITIALYTSTPRIEHVLEEGKILGIPYQYVELIIRETVEGYIVKDIQTGKILEENSLNEDVSYEFRTKGLIVFMPEVKFSDIEPVDYIERAKAYHAVEHALIYAAQICIGAGQTDLGGISYPTGEIIIYDSHLGGSGLSKQLAHRLGDVLEIAYKIVSSCKCLDGCPKCIYSPYCGNNNRYLSRRNAARVLNLVLKGQTTTPREIPTTVKGYV